jgi:uncharacterized protein YjiS (DUF1127 family)
MSTSSDLPIVSLAARFLLRFTQIVRAIAGFVMAIGNRGDVRLLLDMDEHGLKDIGLTRSDVLDALAQPLIKDPSKILLVRSVERRAHIRALALAPIQAPRRTVRI